MKWFRLFLAVGASLLAMTAHAAADPVSIGFFLFAGPLGAVFSFGTLVTAAQIGLVALGVGASLAAGAIGRRNQKIDPGQYKNTFESAETSELNAGGRVMLGGIKAFGNTAGTDRYRLLLHSRGKLDAIEEHYLGGRPVVVDANGDVASPPYAKPGGSWLNIQTKIGDGTETAWTALKSAFPALWTDDHKVRGIYQSLVKYVSPGLYTAKFGKLYQGGEPDYANVCRVGHVYDPRDNTQSAGSPATWKWSTNGILWVAHVLSRYPELTMASFDWEDIALEATKADASVATLTGTEPRSRFSGIWQSEAARGDTVEDMLESVGAEISMSDDGLIRIRLIDDEPEEQVSFTTRDIIEWSWKSGPEAVERPNVCRVRYYSPERRYEMAEIDMTGIAWARIDDEVDRYGEKYFDVELPYCPSASQAQRIARRLFLMARADRGAVQANWAGLAAWGLYYATFDFGEDLDETLLTRIEPPRIDDAAGQVEIPFVVWPQELIDEPWDPETMEAPAPEQLPDLQNESPLDKPATPTEVIVVQYPSGGAYETRVKFAGVTGGVVAEANYRTYTTGLPNQWQSMSEYQGVSGSWYGWATANIAGSKADFRSRFFDANEEASYFSDTFAVDPVVTSNTAPGAPVTSTTTITDVGTIAIRITARAPEMRVVKMVFEAKYTASSGGFDWTVIATHNDVRPDVAIVEETPTASTTAPVDADLMWRVRTFTSNDTPGTYAEGQITIPGIGI